MAKIYSLSLRNRAAATLFGVGIVALGAVFLTLGFALLLGLVAAGGIIGAGMAGYRLLRGSRGEPRATARIDFGTLSQGAPNTQSGLDPALEVRPAAKAVIEPRGTND